MYTAPISLSRDDFKKIRSRSAELVKEVTEVAIHSEAEILTCFDIDFFSIERGFNPHGNVWHMPCTKIGAISICARVFLSRENLAICAMD